MALGRTTTGLFGTPDSWVALVGRTANRAGDRAWALPLFEDYREQLRSEIADLANIGGRPAGAITAALFLKEFTGGLPWAHLDIAGRPGPTSRSRASRRGRPAWRCRTLAELALRVEEWPPAAQPPTA